MTTERGKSRKRSRILLVDSDAGFSNCARQHLCGRGYDVAAYADGPPAVAHLEEDGLPSVALVNFSLPSMNGFEFARTLKSMADVPIIFLACEPGQDLSFEGLKKYAEDFIVKPFDFGELETRMQISLTRMPQAQYISETLVRVDERLSIDFAHNLVTVDGERASLTPIESGMLHVLLSKATRVVDNETLLARVWPREKVHVDTLRVHMHRLRRKLETDAHHPHYIRTERGVGYRFTQRPAEAPRQLA